MPSVGSQYSVRTVLVDEVNANPYRAWSLMGRERNPSRAQVQKLREAAQPATRYQTFAGRLDLQLEKNAVMLVDLIPFTDHSGEYYELDQGIYDNLSI